MIISHRKRFIFIHIWKAAGTSVKSALRPHADVMYRKYTPRRVLYVLGLLDSIGEHASARELKQRLPAAVFDNYFKFAFVRNPWSWQVSLYHYIRGNPFHPEHRRIKRIANFRAYLEWRVANDKVLQKDFVADTDGTLLVDYLGRFETLNEDFSTICSRIGIESNLPHKNPSEHLDYRHYYDDYTRRLIEEHYAEDIAYFGYEYDQPRQSPGAPAAHAS